MVWICTDGSVEAAIESSNGTYSGPYDLGMSAPRSDESVNVGEDAPMIAMDAAGDVVVAWGGWSDPSGDPTNPAMYESAVFVATMEVGQPFSPADQLSASTASWVQSVAMDQNGDSIVTWWDDAPTPDSAPPYGGNFSIMRSGGLFGPAQSIPNTIFGGVTCSNNQYELTAALNDSGEIVFGLGIGGIAITHDWGASFTGGCLGHDGHQPPNEQVAIDPSGNITVVYSTEGTTGGSRVIEEQTIPVAGNPTLTNLYAGNGGFSTPQLIADPEGDLSCPNIRRTVH